MLTDKAITMCLLEILKEYSDENYIMTMKDILSKMESIYGLKPDRRTIYSSAATLIDFGYDISVYEENGKGYFLRERDFEHSEIIMLTDAVYSFPFVSGKQSDELIDKLQKQLSVHQRKKIKNLSVIRSEHKSLNPQVFWNIEQLDEAITKSKQVRFTYLQYDLDKKLHSRRAKPYIVNPYSMVYMNEHYYLVCNLVGYPNISLYRIDFISNIDILETSSEERKEFRDNSAEAVFAFTGTPEHISMVCDKIILGDVVDKFGKDIQLYENNEKTFKVNFTAPAKGVKFWALQYLPYVEVLKPEWIRQEIVDSVKANKYKELL